MPGANNAQLKIEITRQSGVGNPHRLFNTDGSVAADSYSGMAMFLPNNGMVSASGNSVPHVSIRGNWFVGAASGQIPDHTGFGSVFNLGRFNRSIIIGGPNPADR